MTTASDYWYGRKKVELSAGDVTAAKIKDHNKFSHALIAMNNAFRVFYDARQLIDGMTNTRLKAAMTRDLDSVGRTGWGIGVDDLEEALAHVAANDGKWTDNSISTMGWLSSNKICGNSATSQIGYLPIPISLEHFLDALDSKGKAMNEQLKALSTNATTVVNKVTSAGDKVLPKVGTAEWTTFGDGLKVVDSANGKIESMLWLASISEHSSASVANANLGKILSATGKVRGAVDNFDKAARAGMGVVEGAAFAAICEGLGYLPILGSFYQEAFQLIPGISVGMKNIVDKRNALAAQLGVDLRVIH